MLKKSSKYILGLSGGPDSVFLFNYLLDNGFKNFVVCHVNYNFRKDSNQDLELVKKMCKKYEIEYFIKNIKQDYNNLKENFESWARTIRYDFFCEQFEKQKADAILIAHNLNDHIETYLMQKNNKKKVRYFGINSESYYKNKKILRPILSIKKSDIIKDLDEKNIGYIIDSTNSDLKYERNKLRFTLRENTFNKLIKEIDIKNEKILNYKLKIEDLIYSNVLNIDKFNDDNEWNEYLLFSFLERNQFSYFLYKTKKAIIREFLKQILSKKKLVEIKKGNLILMKDYELIRVVNSEELDTFEIENSNDKFFKKLLIENNIVNHENIVVTNNWKKYQSKLLVNDKFLSKIYRDKKINYLKRYKNILIFDKTKKILLNKINI
ncbi:tRNA lysidine(34) synthetase TilS [Spiroplasma cantharicola]|uniref:tRNA lysidine(34) synthetase TilS n=1 Tax=Spiroplasma cantharicola TaxID=362837 RepID=UPI00130EB9F6|nr:tRNA lysidine(34) synthetase TilS [Spiroplasma cantharicola]